MYLEVRSEHMKRIYMLMRVVGFGSQYSINII